MPTFLDDKRFSISEAARRLGVHTATVWRWTLRGVRGHRLRTVHVGGRRHVLAHDLEQFLIALNTDGPFDQGDRCRRADAAGDQLDIMGVREVNPKP